MWDYDALVGKAKLYFDRAQDVPDATDDASAVWLMLGLEFLLRAPLARVSPTLLADPTGDSIMHALGYGGVGKEPKSIQTATVISRLGRIVDGFTKAHEEDASLLTAMRNRELHTSEAAFASVDVAQWLPPFTRLIDVIAPHLGTTTDDLIGVELMRHGRALVDAEDKKLAHEVAKRIEAAKQIVAALLDTEVAARRAVQCAPDSDSAETISCPGCGLDVALELKAVRETNEQLVDGEIQHDVVYVADKVNCAICGLSLAGTAEIKNAGLPQQITRTESESFADRFLSNYAYDDYGND